MKLPESKGARAGLAVVVVLASLLIAGGAVYLLSPGTVLRAAQAAERGRAGLVEAEIEVDGHRVVYVTGGEGPVLLLVHGFAADLDHWTRMAAHLTGSYRVVALDLPGFGRSTRAPDGDYAIRTQVERLDAFTRAVGLGPHHVAGSSMGGTITAVYAATHRERVLSVGLFANGGITSPVLSEMREREARGETPLLASTPEDFDRILSFVFEEVPPIPGAIRAYLAERAVANRESNARVSAQIHAEGVDVATYLPRITAPVFVIWGDRDRLLHVSSLEVMRPLLPGATVVVLEGVGHLPMVERPEESARHYLDFLASAVAPGQAPAGAS